ncbi:MAG: hypothetical protein K6E81_00335 [Lachnospiraceae bacterium]|nr:hypothetical protein [Lachnospiraceae bacterium]
MSIYSGKESVFKYFEEITQIPRHTGKEKAIADYIAGCNQKHHHELKIDSDGNILIYVPSSTGYENEPTILLHADLDMPYEQDDDSDRDLTVEGLDLNLAGSCLYAEGSSLGAAGAFGIAAMLMIMNDDELRHPKLQLLFTAGRYDGMRGAGGFDASSLYGKDHILISLTGTDSSVFLIGKNPDRKCMHHAWTYGYAIPVCLKAIMYRNMQHIPTSIRPAAEETEVDLLKAALEEVASDFNENIRFDAMIMGPDIDGEGHPGESVTVASIQECYNLLRQLLLTKEQAYTELYAYDKDSVRQFETPGSSGSVTDGEDSGEGTKTDPEGDMLWPLRKTEKN